jgi:glycosyltransferase involved in cell wall biosynthesis
MDAIEFQRPATPGLVSIVMPTRGGARLIGDTLATIGSQTYREWELIVVEDGSNDGAREIVARFAEQHPNNRVDYSRNERSYGAAYSRNVAFAKCAGEFVALLDSDDRWLPEHLARAVAALRKCDAEIVYSTVLMVEDKTEIPLGIWGPSHIEMYDFPQSLFGRSFVTPSATVLRRHVLSDVGPWSTAHKYCEDFDFWLRCVEAGKKFHCLGGCTCFYRKNHAGATTTKICGTLEEVAQTTERYMHMAGMRPKTCRKYAAKAYLLAAQMHATVDQKCDPSADPARAGQLMLKGWRLRPKRLKYLFRGLWWSLRSKWKNYPAAAIAPPTISALTPKAVATPRPTATAPGPAKLPAGPRAAQSTAKAA